MKLYIKIFILIVLLAYALKGCVKKKGNSVASLKKDKILYNESIKTFLKVNVNEINEKIDNDNEFFLYTGRVTCPWCIKFAPILSDLALEQDISIYYLDSENTKKDSVLKQFRDNYGIEYVPSLIHFKSHKRFNTLELNITSKNFNKDFLDKLIKPYN